MAPQIFSYPFCHIWVSALHKAWPLAAVGIEEAGGALEKLSLIMRRGKTYKLSGWWFQPLWRILVNGMTIPNICDSKTCSRPLISFPYRFSTSVCFAYDISIVYPGSYDNSQNGIYRVLRTASSGQCLQILNPFFSTPRHVWMNWRNCNRRCVCTYLFIYIYTCNRF